jgi:prepilin-type N-terminal cleavage/methylation domain-containing protein
MSSRPSPVRLDVGSAGVTLVEVLVAMLILSVGLLALQALTAAAIRTAGRADRSTHASIVATSYMEDALAWLRAGRLPPALDCTLANGDAVARSARAVEDPRLAAVEVRVELRPPTAPHETFTVRSHVYSPDGFAPSEGAAACP